MATYKGIKGFSIQNLSADPSNPIEGEMWYNSTSSVWKVEELTTAGTWASGGNINTTRGQAAAAGTQNATVYFGGRTSTANVANSEEYDGSAWTNTPNLNTARRTVQGNAGTQTAALAFGGLTPASPGVTAATELWNGSAWSNNPTGLNLARWNLAGCGLQTAALAISGQSATANVANVEEFNGTNWTANPVNVNTGREGPNAVGTQTAALVFGGLLPPQTAATELWNGSTWTTVSSLNTAISNTASFGISTAAVSAGGATNPPGGVNNTAQTEVYDGTSWSINPNSLGTSRYMLTGSGTFSAGLAIGGGPTFTNVTEEWTGPGVAVTKTITVS